MTYNDRFINNYHPAGVLDGRVVKSTSISKAVIAGPIWSSLPPPHNSVSLQDPFHVLFSEYELSVL